ncbi:carboxymuconolactone decarboxylase family protein [Microvirgula aerodenitrificans]|uniref:carboxymuconolactone decarboxylase family protein n=1 Tax=Microvirgula aerodenitrificans TaxID=57480 RepID=UPI00048D0682|nr:carboxymuconolactone decarboxylase family protein [Microvirgula aerodenitrificans]
MSRFPIHSPDSAPEAARDALNSVRQASGFIPNLIGVLANAPTALETYRTVSAINARSSLNAAEREVVQLTAATTHGCAFCVAGHSAMVEKQALLPPAVLAALRERHALDDPRLNALARFTLAVIAGRGQVDDDAYATFLAAGFTPANALDAVLGVSLATLCNFANNLAQTPLNPELATWRWDAPAAARA